MENKTLLIQLEKSKDEKLSRYATDYKKYLCIVYGLVMLYILYDFVENVLGKI